MVAELTVVVPVLNEERRLPAALPGLLGSLAGLDACSEVLVVDNGSTDGSVELVAAFAAASTGPVAITQLHCAERGKGAAVRAGVLAATGRRVGFCDADLATDPAAFGPALELLRSGAQVVVGSRAHRDSIVSDRHGVLRQGGAWAFRAAVGRVVPGVGDTQCGFKLFDRPLAQRVFADLVTPGFAFDVEVLARAQRAGATVVELPVRWTDVPGSTFSPLRDGWRSFAAVAAINRLLRAYDRDPVVAVVPAPATPTGV